MQGAHDAHIPSKLRGICALRKEMKAVTDQMDMEVRMNRWTQQAEKIKALEQKLAVAEGERDRWRLAPHWHCTCQQVDLCDLVVPRSRVDLLERSMAAWEERQQQRRLLRGNI